MPAEFDLKSEIEKEHSKKNTLRLARWVGHDTGRFARLMELFLADDLQSKRRSSWVMTYCIERHPELAVPWIKILIAQCMQTNAHDAIQRNVMRSLQFVDIPRGKRGIVVNAGFDILQSARTSIAAKAFFMTVLANIANREPDLKKELILVLEEILAHPGTAGLHSRARHVLKKELLP
jgi:hypothetical protein